MSSKNPPPLPDVSNWQPRINATDVLSSAFLARCLAIEQSIQLRAHHECALNINNFDSGSGIEDMVRD